MHFYEGSYEDFLKASRKSKANASVLSKTQKCFFCSTCRTLCLLFSQSEQEDDVTWDSFMTADYQYKLTKAGLRLDNETNMPANRKKYLATHGYPKQHHNAIIANDQRLLCTEYEFLQSPARDLDPTFATYLDSAHIANNKKGLFWRLHCSIGRPVSLPPVSRASNGWLTE